MFFLCSYVANFLLNDPDEVGNRSKQQVQNSLNKVEGGELEIIRMEKFAGMDALVKNQKCFHFRPWWISQWYFVWLIQKVGGRLPANSVEKMNYGPPGKAVLCQVLLLIHLGNQVDDEHKDILWQLMQHLWWQRWLKHWQWLWEDLNAEKGRYALINTTTMPMPNATSMLINKLYKGWPQGSEILHHVTPVR